MIVRIVILFLIFMAVLAMLGRLRLPKITRRGGLRGGLPKPRYCKQCAQYKLRGESCEKCNKGRG